ncbi:hypothetical protein FBD94_04730 [Pedobacter hiemivivus]|uniref:FAS1 domain-containing protein n=1 Tax=Pedobacter hiemivivus TaxID=2530454 RepID=A0A4U1GKZ9_9SPHI|nr:fasciclin domain-containing protein [Pedobacter hiemivivus]TKC63660.1 hypothetical protein FBD94_04730 [Pedobacter hiemivivus]
MKKLNLFNYLGCVLLGSIVFFGCDKTDKGDYDYTNLKTPFKGNTYEFLKSKPGIFDSVLVVIDRLGLKEVLEKERITLFAPTNQSFVLALNKLNNGKTISSPSYVSLSKYRVNNLDSLMCRYMIAGLNLSDSMTLTDGKTMKSYKYNYPMNGKRNISRSEGYQNGGASLITFSDTRRSSFKASWLGTVANSIDIRTTNGIVHILEPGHLFGYNDFYKPIRSPFKGLPFEFPSVINAKAVLEAEDFDKGGEGVAYHATVFPSKNYRPTEGFRLENHGASTAPLSAGYSFPSTWDLQDGTSGDWVIYTINVSEEGDYEIMTRYRNRAGINSDFSLVRYNLSFDFIESSSIAIVKRDSYPVWSGSIVTVHLKKGIHSMRFLWEVTPLELDAFLVKRIN